MGYTSQELHSRVMEILLPSHISPDNVQIGRTTNWGFDVHVLGFKFTLTYELREVLLRQLWFQAIKNISMLPPTLKDHLFKIHHSGVYDRFENRQLATIKDGNVDKRLFSIVPMEVEQELSDDDSIENLAYMGFIGYSYKWDETVYVASHKIKSISKNEEIVCFNFIRRRDKLERISVRINIKGFTVVTNHLRNVSWMKKFVNPFDLYEDDKYTDDLPNFFRQNLGVARYKGINVLVEQSGLIWCKVSGIWVVYNADRVIPTEVHDEIQIYLNTYSIGS